MLGVVILTNAY